MTALLTGSKVAGIAGTASNHFVTKSQLDDLLGPSRTITLPHSNGGLGGSVATSLSTATAGSDRFVVKLPVATSQWRIKIRNWDVNNTTKTAATLKKLIFGVHARQTATPAAETGSFVGNTATTIVSTDQTIPGTSGAWYTSPWVTASGDQFQPDVEHLIGFGWTISPSTVVQTGAGRSWHWTNSTSGPDPTVAGSGGTQTYIPFDWVIEYECTTRRKVFLVVGDSIYEGISGTNAALASTALWRNAVNLWAAKHNALVVNVSLAGITLAYFGGATPSLISRQSVAGITDWAGIIIAAGSNDFNSGRTLAQMQADVLATIANVQSMMSIPTDTPVYMGTLLARGSTGDAVRLTYNEWLSSLPTFIGDSGGDVIDFDGATRGTTAQNLVDQYTPDSIHPSWLGNIAIRDKLAAVLP